jgi:hypothetical protein
MSETFQKIAPASWRLGPHRTVVSYADYKHVPYNKRAWEIKQSTATLTVTNCLPNDNNDGWLAVELEEVTTSEKGNVQSRTISVSLSPALCDDLIAALTATP